MLRVLFLTAALLVSGCLSDLVDPKDAKRLSGRLDDITGRIEKIEKKIDFRLSDKNRARARSLLTRVEALEEDHCDKDHVDCGGQDHECVSRLMVCDGRRDCRNGFDEKHCESPVNASDIFIGYKVFDHCGPVPPIGDKIVVKIHRVTHFPAFPPGYQVLAKIKAGFTDGKSTTRYGWPARGYYSHAQRALVLLPPPGENRGLRCVFDGADWNKCVGSTTSVASLEVCAKYVYFRKGHEPEYLHDDDHDDHHNHH